MASNPFSPVSASPIVPPPAFNLPFVQFDQAGQLLLTPTAIDFLQTLWASIQGAGGIFDITSLNNNNPGAVQGLSAGLISEIAAALTLLTPPSNTASSARHADDVALLLTRPAVPLPVPATMVLNEVPAGAVDGVNVTFTLANTPTSAGILLFQNGLLKKPATNYTLTGNTITMAIAPIVADVLLAAYQW